MKEIITSSYKKLANTLVNDPNLDLLRKSNPVLYSIIEKQSPQLLEKLREDPQKIQQIINNPQMANQLRNYNSANPQQKSIIEKIVVDWIGGSLNWFVKEWL